MPISRVVVLKLGCMVNLAKEVLKNPAAQAWLSFQLDGILGDQSLSSVIFKTP